MSAHSTAPGTPAVRAPLRRTTAGVVAAISLGGMLGASARYGLSQVVPTVGEGLPWATLAENISGSFLLGFVVILAARRLPPSMYLLPFMATGALGSYTTFSALVIEGEALLRDGAAVLAGTYWVLSLTVGAAAAFAGMVSSRACWPAAAVRTPGG